MFLAAGRVGKVQEWVDREAGDTGGSLGGDAGGAADGDLLRRCRSFMKLH